MKEESVGKSGDGTFTEMEFWNLRAKMMGFCIKWSLYSETAGILFHFILFYYFFGGPCCAACEILVPQPGIEPGPSAVKAQSPNHWTAKESPETAGF